MRNQAGLVAAGAASDGAAAIFACDGNTGTIPISIAAGGADVAHNGAAGAVFAPRIVVSFEASAVTWARPAAVGGNLTEGARCAHA